MCCKLIILLALTAVRADITDLLPSAFLAPDWSLEFAPDIYHPENLHDYINGQAELFKQYEFVEMVTAYYVHRKDPMRSMTVDIYKMANALDAFGIYSRYRKPDMTFADIGEQAIISLLNVRFWQDKYYVNIVAGSLDSSLTHLIQDIAGHVSTKLPKSKTPELLDILPKEGRVANSLRYIKPTYLGLSSVSAFEAHYVNEPDSGIGFIISCKNAEQAQRSFQQLDNNDMQIILHQDKIFGMRDFAGESITHYFFDQLKLK
jgi:hypothetical protein